MIKLQLFKPFAVRIVLDLFTRFAARVFATGVLCVAFANIGYCAETDKPLTLMVIRTPDESSNAIALEATLQNVSKRDITLNAQDPIVDYTITVTDQRGVPVPFSKRGEELFSKDRIRRTRSIEVKLAPGEIRQDTLAVGEIYNFKIPGRYLVVIARQFWTAEGSGSVSSKVLDVLVKAPANQRASQRSEQ